MLVDVNGMLAWRKLLDIQDDLHTLGYGRKSGRADWLAFGVFDGNDDGFA
jgi:hypothetical protein